MYGGNVTRKIVLTSVVPRELKAEVLGEHTALFLLLLLKADERFFPSQND